MFYIYTYMCIFYTYLCAVTAAVERVKCAMLSQNVKMDSSRVLNVLVYYSGVCLCVYNLYSPSVTLPVHVVLWEFVYIY